MGCLFQYFYISSSVVSTSAECIAGVQRCNYYKHAYCYHVDACPRRQGSSWTNTNKRRRRSALARPAFSMTTRPAPFWPHWPANVGHGSSSTWHHKQTNTTLLLRDPPVATPSQTAPRPFVHLSARTDL